MTRFVALLLLLALPATAAVLHVEADGSGQYATIQAALNAAADGDIIALAPGTYRGSGNTNLELYDNVTVRGTGAVPSLTVIDCDGSASSPRAAFNLAEETGGTIENLTVREGWATNGGAINSGWGSYTFRDCIFADNHATNGGVWYGSAQGDITFEGCVFYRNTADGYGGCLMATDETDLTVRQCTFTNNDALSGAGVFLETDATATIENTIMAWNRGGSAASDNYSTNWSIDCSDFYGNVGGDFPGGASGSGNFSADPRLLDPWGASPDVGLATSSPCRDDMACGTMGAGREEEYDGCFYRLNPDGTGMVATIQDAIDLVQDQDDAISLADGTYTGTGNQDLQNNGRSFTLAAASLDPATCRLEPDLPRRHMDITGDNAVVRFDGLGFYGGSTAGSNQGGGSLRIRRISTSLPGPEVWIIRSKFRDNEAATSGGAVDMRGGHLHLSDSVFELNTSAGNGGAINCVEVMIDARDCRIEGNISTGTSPSGWQLHSPGDGSTLSRVDFGNHPGRGMVVFSLDGSLTLTSCMFWDNEAHEAGAGIYVSGTAQAAPTLTDCEFNGNISEGIGGGVAAEVEITVRDSRFLNNRAYHGGGIGSNNVVRAENCEFRNNLASLSDVPQGHGGGIYADILYVTDSTFDDCDALLAGGAYATSTLSAEGCEFRNCFAGKGGGLASDGAFVELVDTHFDNCSAQLVGGAIQITGGSFTYQGGTINGCHATRGGAILVTDYADVVLHISYVAMTNNTAVSRGGALDLYGDGTNVYLESCTLHNNTVDNQTGTTGQFYLTTSSTLEVSHCLITGNPSGAAFEIDSSTVTAHCTNIWGNAEGNWTGDLAEQLGINGNMSANPLYCDAVDSDLTVATGSPCLPENNSCGALIGLYDQGCEGIVGVDDTPAPAHVSLAPPSPNPFNPMTNVAFSLPTSHHARLEIVDLQGKKVALLVDERLDAGQHTVTWNGRDDAGRDQPSGIYLARLVTDDGAKVQKMALVR